MSALKRDINVIHQAVTLAGAGEEDASAQITTQATDHSGSNATSGVWEDPLPLKLDLPPVKPFDLELLPESFRPFVQDVSERMQVPPDYPAIVAVLCLAGVVNRRAVIQPKAQDDTWQVVPNLWGGLVAPSGYMKSPVMQSVTNCLKPIEEESREAHREASEIYLREKDGWELGRAHWKKLFKKSLEGGGEQPPEFAGEPSEPTPKRLVLNDSTFEALHEIMAHTSEGVLVVRDEFVGWLAELDRSGREGERSFYLTAWNGDTGHTIDRIGRGSVRVEACCLSMLVGVQPGPLKEYLDGTLEKSISEDGLLFRFQLLVWPDAESKYEYVDRTPNAAAMEQVKRIYSTLADLDAADPLKFRFSDEAQPIFVRWLTTLEERLRSGELHGPLLSHLSKFRSLMPSLALLFELADRAAGGFVGFDGANSEAAEKFEVSLDHTQQAVKFCEYLESHARRIHGVWPPAWSAAVALMKKILEQKLGTAGPFSCRDVYGQGWSELTSAPLVDGAISLLVQKGLLREVKDQPSSKGGRPTVRYEVNPKIWSKAASDEFSENT